MCLATPGIGNRARLERCQVICVAIDLGRGAGEQGVGGEYGISCARRYIHDVGMHGDFGNAQRVGLFATFFAERVARTDMDRRSRS